MQIIGQIISALGAAVATVATAANRNVMICNCMGCDQNRMSGLSAQENLWCSDKILTSMLEGGRQVQVNGGVTSSFIFFQVPVIFHRKPFAGQLQSKGGYMS
jgi:hypothetical protein